MGFDEILGVTPVINACGPLTRMSGMPVHPEVAEAMACAAQRCARIEDLQRAAGKDLAEACGAEAGYVTAGAAAGLTLSAAAVMARDDVAAMDQLPDTTGLPNEIIAQRPHITTYSHALRVAGAKLIDVGYSAGYTWPWQVEKAINERTAAIFYSVGHGQGIVELPELAEIGRRHEIPVIVDAAAALPPKENLRRFIAEGADLVTFSGGKAIGGPQSSGILVGRRNLIDSVALQHQDMDVHPNTWTWRDQFIASGRLPGPPHHGIGRSMKVGKEEIVGLVVALRRFLNTDIEAEQQRQIDDLRLIADQVNAKTSWRTELVLPGGSARPYPTLFINTTTDNDGKRLASDVVNRLIDGDPPVAVVQSFMHCGAIVILASAMREGEASIVADRLVSEIAGQHRNKVVSS